MTKKEKDIINIFIKNLLKDERRFFVEQNNYVLMSVLPVKAISDHINTLVKKLENKNK